LLPDVYAERCLLGSSSLFWQSFAEANPDRGNYSPYKLHPQCCFLYFALTCLAYCIQVFGTCKPLKRSDHCCCVQVERDRNLLLQQSFKQLNTQYSRRTNGTSPPLVVHRVKVTFRDEPGEGSGVARSFYTAFCQAVLSAEKLPSLEGILVGSKNLQFSMF
jgi:hypothetical protein